MNKKKKTILYIIVITLISIFLSIIILKLIKDPKMYIDTINKKHLSVILSFVLLSITQTIIPIIPGEPIELLAGYLFGKINGSIICFICEAVSSIVVVLISRRYGNKIINYIFNEKNIKKIEKIKSRKSFNIFALLFIIPGTPKDILCYFSGIADYELIPLLIIVTIGRIPSIVSSTISAGLLQEKKYIISIIVYVITLIVCLIDILIYKKYINNKKD